MEYKLHYFKNQIKGKIMKILITGGSGQLGTDLTLILKNKSYTVYSFSSKDLDITVIDKFLKKTKELKPDIIINCAAYTNVDGCETEREKAFMVNAIGAKNCAIVADTVKSKLFHISTDYIFNGNKKSPYTEYDSPNPESVYATSKYFGENLIKEHYNNFFILRVAGVYGIHGNNFVKTIIKYAKEKDELKVVNDQVTTPTYTIDICNQIIKLLETDNYGVYHCSCEGECSWYEFTKFILNKLNINTKVVPCTTDEYPRPAKRPTYSVMENFNLKLLKINVMRHWQEAVTEFLSKHFCNY